MKALWHSTCSTIISPPPDGRWVACHCGGAAARWRDPAKGLFEVAEKGRDGLDQRDVRVIGFHNGWLALDGEFRSLPDEVWPDATQQVLDGTPDTYLFKRRMSPVVIIAPGTTGDTFRMPWDYVERDERVKADAGGG